MITRWTYNFQYKENGPLTLNMLMAAAYEAHKASGKKPTRLEMSRYTYDTLRQDPAFPIHDAEKQLDLEFVLAMDQRDDIIRIVHEWKES